jgi:hypothetical protein
MESVYHVVTLRLNETSWAHVWRLRSRYLETGYDIYKGEWDLQRLGEVSLVPGGGRAAKPRGWLVGWSGLHWLSPLSRASPPRVDAWQLMVGSNRPKPYAVGGPLGQLGLGSGPLVPRVKYTPVVMMILTFGQLHFVISWNAPIWYLSCWNKLNTKIVELGL